jgi:UMF1 family MFS transporter
MDIRKVRRSWYLYDWANSAFSTTVVTVFLGPYLTNIANDAADENGFINFLGFNIRGGSLYPYAISISVIMQVLILPIVGSVADRIKNRNLTLGFFAYLGAISTMLLYFVGPGDFTMGALLFILANVSFGSALVVYNSYLPDIASPDERDVISSRGWAMGYAGGGLLLIANLALFLSHESLGISSEQAVRISLFSAGFWWAMFGLITIRGVKPLNRPQGDVGKDALVIGFKELNQTYKDIKKYPETFKFLIAYLLYNDGIQTVIALSGTYAIIELMLDESALVTTIIIVQSVALIGSLALGRLALRYGSKKVVLGSLVVWSTLVFAAYFIPVGSTYTYYALGAGIGFVLGGSQALSRSLYSQVIPKEKEAKYFSFYEIAERGTSWIGTAAFGIAYSVTGSYRISILLLVVFFVIGGLLLTRVDVRKAIEQAGNKQPRVV